MNFLRKNCAGHSPVTRRHLLFGAATAASSGLLKAHPDAEVTTRPATGLRGTARSCIFINLNGAPSHLDLFNPQDGPWNARDADLRQHAGGMVLSNKFFPSLSKITGDLQIGRAHV